MYTFDWFNTYIPEKILGLLFGNEDCTKLNIDRRLQSLRNTIAAWKHRELSFKGKALVINGLLTSTLWYTATSIHLPPPPRLLQKLNRKSTISFGTTKNRLQLAISLSYLCRRVALISIVFKLKFKPCDSTLFADSSLPNQHIGNTSQLISFTSNTCNLAYTHSPWITKPKIHTLLSQHITANSSSPGINMDPSNIESSTQSPSLTYYRNLFFLTCLSNSTTDLLTFHPGYQRALPVVTTSAT